MPYEINKYVSTFGLIIPFVWRRSRSHWLYGLFFYFKDVPRGCSWGASDPPFVRRFQVTTCNIQMAKTCECEGMEWNRHQWPASTVQKSREYKKMERCEQSNIVWHSFSTKFSTMLSTVRRDENVSRRCLQPAVYSVKVFVLASILKIILLQTQDHKSFQPAGNWIMSVKVSSLTIIQTERTKVSFRVFNCW